MSSDLLLPRPDRYSEPFWEALKSSTLSMPKCRECGHIQYPMGPCCSQCLCQAFDWITLSGRGQVEAFVVYHHAFHPSLRARVPYNVAEVRLDEGVRLITNVIESDANPLRNGLKVQAVYEAAGEFKLLKFAPVTESAG